MRSTRTTTTAYNGESKILLLENDMMRLFSCLALLFICSCSADNMSHNNEVLSVDQLRGNPEYASKTVDVRGEVIHEYHGTTLCNPEGDSGFFVVLDSEFKEDYLYEKYKDLSIETGLVQKKLGNARLFATLRGRFEHYTYTDDGEEIVIDPQMTLDPVKDFDLITGSHRVRFILQKVLELDIRKGSGKPDPWMSNDPADWEEILNRKDN